MKRDELQIDRDALKVVLCVVRGLSHPEYETDRSPAQLLAEIHRLAVEGVELTDKRQSAVYSWHGVLALIDVETDDRRKLMAAPDQERWRLPIPVVLITDTGSPYVDYGPVGVVLGVHIDGERLCANGLVSLTEQEVAQLTTDGPRLPVACSLDCARVDEQEEMTTFVDWRVSSVVIGSKGQSWGDRTYIELSAVPVDAPEVSGPFGLW